MGQLDGKVAVITGATTGIGLATARRFAAESARVFATGRTQVRRKMTRRPPAGADLTCRSKERGV